MAGKGDTYRKVNYKKWAEEYDRIFKKKSSFKKLIKKHATTK